jgi:hypothetical protein
MNPEQDLSGITQDGMSVHPDWNHIETLTIQPGSDTLILVPCHALFKSETNVKSPEFDPMLNKSWSLNEFQDQDEVRLMIEHIRVGVLSCARIQNSILVFSGGCTRVEGEGWTEGASYYAVADFYDWWMAETKLPLHEIKARAFVDVFAFDSMDNLWMSIRLFQLAHPRKEVPKKVIVINYTFKKKMYELHAKILGIPEFEFIGLDDPANVANDTQATERINQTIENYKRDPFVEDVTSFVCKKKIKRNVFGINYPYGHPKDVVEAYKKQFKKRSIEN